jgi:hypothetical protein
MNLHTSGQTNQHSVAADQVELSGNPAYVANLLFEKIARRVAEKYNVEKTTVVEFNPSLGASPEATANRIADFVIGFYEPLRAEQGSQDETETLNHFMFMVRGAVDQGFEEARGILVGLSGFTPAIAEMIDEIYQKLLERLNLFEKQIQEGLSVKLLFPAPEISPPKLEKEVQSADTTDK